MSFARPRLLAVNNLSNIVEALYRPPVGHHLATFANQVLPPEVPRREPYRQSGRQRQHSSRPRRAKGGGDDGADEEQDRGDADQPGKVKTSATVTDLKSLPALLTADEAASLLRTTRSAIYTMSERGRLPGATRIGRRLLVCRDTLLLWLDQNRVPSPEGSRR